MIDSKDNKKEKSKNKKSETKIIDIQRNEEKKQTLNLSEIPNVINEETQYYGKPEKGISSIFPSDNASLNPGFINSPKLQNSFVNEPISHKKEESISSIGEIQDLLRETNNEEENKLNVKKDKKQKLHSKRKNSSIEKLGKKKSKEKDNNDMDKDKEDIKIIIINKKDRKKSEDNCFYEHLKIDKSKKVKIKPRKSEIIKPIKKEDLIVGSDDYKKKRKRRSIFSRPARSPSKIQIKNIFNKYLDLNEDERNEDKIYINIDNRERLLITVKTTQKTVKNYYEDMQDCFQLIDLYFNKTIKLQPIEPVNFQFKENKKIIVFELESTLVSCFEVNLPDSMNKTLGINLRPHLKSSLDLIKNDYNIVIYSSSDKCYVDKILDFLDPEHNYFNYRLYKEHCYKFTINDKIYYTKNLNIFKNICSLNDIIIVDCSVLGFGFFLDNGIPIIPFYDSKEDVELRLVSYYLLSISSNYDLRQALKRDMKLNDYLEAAKKKNAKSEKNEIILEKNEEKETKKIKKTKDIKDEKYKSPNVSPAGLKKKANRNSETCREKKIPHIFKEISDSDEDKKSSDNKPKNSEKTNRHKKDSPKKMRYYSTKFVKGKNRKYTTNEMNRLYLDIAKSPKKSSPGKINRHSAKKMNKKIINDCQ